MENLSNVAKGYQIAEIELVYKPAFKITDRPKIVDSKSAYEVILSQWDLNSLYLFESFKVLLLNNGGRVLGIYELSKGGMTSTIVDIRLLFVTALKAGANRIILAHNHPSQNLRPSTCDQKITEKVVNAGKLLNIDVADHLIIGVDGYFSFIDEGLL